MVFPPLKLKVFVEDITVFMEGRYNELAGVAEKVWMFVKGGGELFQVVEHGRRESWTEQGDGVVWASRGDVLGMQKKRDRIDNKRGNVWSGLEAARSKRDGEEAKSAMSRLRLSEDWFGEVAEDGFRLNKG